MRPLLPLSLQSALVIRPVETRDATKNYREADALKAMHMRHVIVKTVKTVKTGMTLADGSQYHPGFDRRQLH